MTKHRNEWEKIMATSTADLKLDRKCYGYSTVYGESA